MESEEKSYFFRSNLSVVNTVHDLKRSIQGNLKENKKLIDTFSDVMYPLFLPCSERQLREDFGAGAFQLPSGKSIVIACGDKVFKLIVSASIDVWFQKHCIHS